MSRRGGRVAAAVLLTTLGLAALALWPLDGLNRFGAWIDAARDGRFGRVMRAGSPEEAAAHRRAQTALAELQAALQAALERPEPVTLEQGAAWKRQLHRQTQTLTLFWAPAARCLGDGDCRPGIRNAPLCEELASDAGRAELLDAALASLEPLLWPGLGGPGLSPPDLTTLQTVLHQGCEQVPQIAAALAARSRADGALRAAEAGRAWAAIRGHPSLESVRRFAAVYPGAARPESGEVEALLQAMEQRLRLVAGKGLCSTLLRAVDAPHSDRKLIQALASASERPAYCVTEPGSATCGWPDFMDRLPDAFPSGAALRADTLIEAMQSCLPVEGTLTRETYDTLQSSDCPAEQRLYTHAGIRVDAVVSHCHYAQVRVSRRKSG